MPIHRDFGLVSESTSHTVDLLKPCNWDLDEHFKPLSKYRKETTTNTWPTNFSFQFLQVSSRFKCLTAYLICHWYGCRRVGSFLSGPTLRLDPNFHVWDVPPPASNVSEAMDLIISGTSMSWQICAFMNKMRLQNTMPIITHIIVIITVQYM